ncbi:hypothetical protein CYLTODRAFT_421843 [Cylindrobasidium torrendii FP15055 ss-10]|uniref:F-box domain-containing protein n=1 Tax=Cylindrobasidium torrendii FP15055 ss-10 TaxID=1314674 RepID=A0A0D7BCE8_9AGAR|nr:hypothetical protein CYLTODRAFT_421843 [Cylindrobasidium torrendii FP15055 ss-10]
MGVSLLPSNILCKIIISAQVCIHDLHFPEYIQVEDNARITTVVSQVCQHWRTATFAFPELWVHIPCHSQQLARLPQLIAHIERSQGRALTFSFYHPWTRETDEEWITFVRKYIDRAEHITILDRDPRTVLSVVMANRTPNLRSLAFRLLGGTANLAILSSECTNAFERLRYVHAYGLVIYKTDPDSSTPKPIFPPGLVEMSLDVQEIPTQTVLAPSAETLTSLTLGSRVSFKGSGPPVVLISLQKLVVSDNTDFPRGLRVPNIVRLELRNFYTRSVHQLIRTLRNTWADMPVPALQDILIGLPEDCWRNGNGPMNDMSSLFASFPCVRRVHVDTRWPLVLGGWGRALRNESYWPELRHVAVRNEETYEALRWALPDSRRDVIKVDVLHT